MDALDRLAHINKHRPSVAEVVPKASMNDDPDDVKRMIDAMDRLFRALWESEHQLSESLRYSWMPFRKARFSQAALGRYMACLKNMQEYGLISQERFDVIAAPLNDVPSYH